MFQFIITNLNDILIAISSIIAGASALTAMTPNKKDDGVLMKTKQFLDVLALNIGNAKRA